jgi:hypothetical protein
MSQWAPQPGPSDGAEATTAPQASRGEQNETLQIAASPDTQSLSEADHEPAAAAEPAREPTPDLATVTPGPSGGRRGVRLRTMVFGAVMLVISVVTLVALTTGVRVDGATVLLTLLLAAGAVLVAGGAASAVRESRGGPGAGR